jgi:hypothetical protein
VRSKRIARRFFSKNQYKRKQMEEKEISRRGRSVYAVGEDR